MSALVGRFHDLVATLEEEGHHLADEARALLDHYEKDAAAVAAAVKPVLGELRDGITADVKDAAARIEAAVAKVEALLAQQPPAGN